MELKKGKTYYVSGCSVSYQKQNPVTAKFIRECKEEVLDYFHSEDVNGPITTYRISQSISEDGRCWYPARALTDKLGG